MSDRLFYPLAGLAFLALVALAAVYPQGVGARSPAPFGHETAAHRAARLKPAATPPPLKSSSHSITLQGPM